MSKSRAKCECEATVLGIIIDMLDGGVLIAWWCGDLTSTDYDDVRMAPDETLQHSKVHSSVTVISLG